MGLLRGVGHVGIRVADIDRTIAFYTEILGMKVTERHEPGELRPGTMGAAFLRCGQNHHDLSVFFGPPDRVQPAGPDADTGRGPIAGPHHFAFLVDDRAAFEAMLARIRERGIPIVHGPVKHSPTHPDGDGTWGENRSFYFCDPDGNRIEITCEMAHLPE
jgi:catechol 2,3-dioxygenase-like lactoylglutathione lyase family enzyme